MPWVIVVFIASQQSDALPVIQCLNVINLFLVCSYAVCPNHFAVDAETEKYARGVIQTTLACILDFPYIFELNPKIITLHIGGA